MLNTPIFVLPVRAAKFGLACALAGGVLAGCTSVSMQDGAQEYVLSRDSGTPIQNARLNEFLDGATAAGATTLAASPWGNNVDIVADAAYFSASGRQCRRLRIVTADQQARQALVCHADGSWVEQRLVTQTAGSVRP